MNLPTHFESLYPDNTRYKVLEELLSYIKQGKSAQIVSLPGVGRANLFGFLSYNHAIREAHLGENQKWFHFVTVNFSEIRKKPLVDVGKFLFLNLLESVRERKLETDYQTLSDIFKEALSFNDELVLFQGLKRAIDYMCLEKEFTLVFLFDRFEAYTSVITDDFFENLHILRNRAKYRFATVFTLNRPLEDVLEPAIFADYYRFLEGHTIYLPILDQPSVDFRIEYLEKIAEKKLDSAVKKQLLILTSGHMKLTRLSAETLVAMQGIVSPKQLQSFLLSLKHIQDACFEIWDALTPVEQQVLLGNMPPNAPRSLYMEDAGLLKNDTIAIPLFASFLAQQKAVLMKLTNNQKFALNIDTGDITKGNMLLSDKLTSSEYKLLRFLLENAEKVVSREDIINFVWGDEKSIAGVTDQALDQLIFRLRKKIEFDPNRPLHLQTVKGRGFKFAA